MGTITRDGILRYLGRKDDMMMLNGINIFPAEIERTLEEHPAVKHAAAFPLASPVFGDIPAAAVELNGTAPVDEPALIAYSRERLGARAPRSIVIVDALPRNAAGKVVKRELAAALATRLKGR
jgi:acyl-coenzyme A synthetase/AMP-(fatty) acid ligase